MKFWRAEGLNSIRILQLVKDRSGVNSYGEDIIGVGSDIIVASLAPSNLDVRVKRVGLTPMALKVYNKCAWHLFPEADKPYISLITSQKVPSEIIPINSNSVPALVQIFSHVLALIYVLLMSPVMTFKLFVIFFRILDETDFVVIV